MRALIVEDSDRLRESLKVALQESGFAVDVVEDGANGLWMAQNHDYDVVLLDIMLPEMDGLTVLERLRESASETKVIVISAKDTVRDRVMGLNAGADDYIVKPFNLEELLARVRAQSRRTYGKGSAVLQVADLKMDTVKKKVTRAGYTVDLTSREFSVLEYLMLRAGIPVTRTEIEAHIYDDIVSPMSNVVDSAIYGLRKKISSDPNSTPLIHTRRGQGYTLEDRTLPEGRQ